MSARAATWNPARFAPYSDVSLKNVALKEALGSRFLSVMRANHGLFSETSSGCALWNNKEHVRALLEEKFG
jgi:hypothetical protein